MKTTHEYQLKKICMHSVVYENKDAPIATIYVKKDNIPDKFPQQVTITLEFTDNES